MSAHFGFAGRASANRRRRALLVTAFGVWTLIVAGFAPVAGFAAGSTPVQAVAMGADAALWVRQDARPWTSFGGVLAAAPAVASEPEPTNMNPGSLIYIATGLDHALYVRNQASPWQRLSTGFTYCIDNPAAVITSAHAAGAYLLTVACQGADHGLWMSQQAPIAFGSLPGPMNSWTSLGGQLTAGPAVAAVDPLHRTVNDELTYFGRGTDGHIWARTVNAAWTQTSWACQGHPAAATTVNAALTGGQLTEFACHGTDGAIWVSNNNGSGWSAAQSLGGAVIDGPGLAVGPSFTTVFAEGTDGQPWQRTMTNGAGAGPWSTPGGAVQHGMGASALQFLNANP